MEADAEFLEVTVEPYSEPTSRILTIYNNGNETLEFNGYVSSSTRKRAKHHTEFKSDPGEFRTVKADTKSSNPVYHRDEIVLSYDSGPDRSLGTGTSAGFICAVRFTAEELAAYYGEYSLTDIQFHIRQNFFTEVIAYVFESGSYDYPGNEIYAADVTSEVIADNWTTHTLDYSIPLVSGNVYWIGYGITVTSGSPASFDAGPVVPGKGAWMYYNNAWNELINISSSSDGNWCIRGIIKQVSPHFSVIPMKASVPAGGSQEITVFFDPLHSINTTINGNLILKNNAFHYNQPRGDDFIIPVIMNINDLNEPPDSATTPNPLNLALAVARDVNLSWSNGLGGFPTGYKISLWYQNERYSEKSRSHVYICQDKDIGFVQSYDPSSDGIDLLNSQTTYFWQVVPYNNFGSAENCPIWSFTTKHEPSENPYFGSISFNGANSFASIPHNSDYNASKVTIEMWVKWSSGNLQFLLGKGMEQLEIHTSPNNSLRFIPTTGVYLDTPAASFFPYEWHHVAFVYAPSFSYYKCYIDGIEIPLTNNGYNPVSHAIYVSTAPISLGKRGDNSFVLAGEICDFRLWNEVRNQGEIQQYMNYYLAGDETGLMAYFPMNEGDGTTIYDYSFAANNGTISNAIHTHYFPGGTGTFDSPWQIKTAQDLNFLRNYSGSVHQDKYFILMNGIDMKTYLTEGKIGAKKWGGSGWNPIGNSIQSFQADFNGNGKVISELTINRPGEQNIGLFGVMENNSVYFLGLENVTIIGNENVGAIAGKNAGIIQNSHASGMVSGQISVGGITGLHSTASIMNSSANVSVQGDSKVGGLIGANLYSTVSYCYSIGNVDGVTHTGGLIGYAEQNRNPVISSYWDINTSTQTASAGGTGKYSSEMKQQITYTDWDFVHIWHIHNAFNNGYPYLQWQTPAGSLLPPAHVQISVSDGIVYLSWDAVSAATSYKILSSASPLGNFTDNQTGTFSGLSWSASISGERLFFKVVSVMD
jgi:hypothetical protein